MGKDLVSVSWPPVGLHPQAASLEVPSRGFGKVIFRDGFSPLLRKASRNGDYRLP